MLWSSPGIVCEKKKQIKRLIFILQSLSELHVKRMFDDFLKQQFTLLWSHSPLHLSWHFQSHYFFFSLCSLLFFFILTCSFEQMLKACIKEHFIRVFCLTSLSIAFIYPASLAKTVIKPPRTCAVTGMSPTNRGKMNFKQRFPARTGSALCAGLEPRSDLWGISQILPSVLSAAPSSFPQYVVVVCYLSQALSDLPSYIHTDTPLCSSLTPSCPRP